jgi:hypothetical protein
MSTEQRHLTFSGVVVTLNYLPVGTPYNMTIDIPTVNNLDQVMQRITITSESDKTALERIYESLRECEIE